jgi:hypothetical protein
MRWFNVRRGLICLFLIPLFLSLLLINNLFLLLDFLFFPRFYTHTVSRPVFIIAAPRSGTTFLFHSLANNSDHFTTVRLWEIVFAPSILQKYLIIGTLKIDRIVGSPMKRIVLRIENLFVGKLKKIHLIGLQMPEEDEALLLWSLSTLYLSFFYPDSTIFSDFYHFDEAMPQQRKERIMRRYRRLIMRHNVVFNRHNTKRFLSKNPLMMNKIGALSHVFPDAYILNINRNPKETLPSTIQLNHTLFGFFTSIPQPERIKTETKTLLIDWYGLAEKNLQQHFAKQYLKINFYDLVQRNLHTWEGIEQFLEVATGTLKMDERKEKTGHKSQHSYVKLSDEETAVVLKKLPFLLDFCAPSSSKHT